LNLQGRVAFAASTRRRSMMRCAPFGGSSRTAQPRCSHSRPALPRCTRGRWRQQPQGHSIPKFLAPSLQERRASRDYPTGGMRYRKPASAGYPQGGCRVSRPAMTMEKSPSGQAERAQFISGVYFAPTVPPDDARDENAVVLLNKWLRWRMTESRRLGRRRQSAIDRKIVELAQAGETQPAPALRAEATAHFFFGSALAA
jgi:hypothetical protein